MHTQTYYHTKLQGEANRRNDSVPLQVNCVGAVSEDSSFSSRAVRRDYYYIYVIKGKMFLETCALLPGDVIVFEPEHPYQYTSEGETTYLWVHYTGFEARSLTKSAGLALNVSQHIGVHRSIVSCFQRVVGNKLLDQVHVGSLLVRPALRLPPEGDHALHGPICDAPSQGKPTAPGHRAYPPLLSEDD